MEIAKPSARISSGFRRIVDVFLAGEGLPFSQILSAERIERICGNHGCLFGQHRIFSTPVVLWAFLSQVLRDGKEAACQAAVASIAAARLERSEEPPTEDTGDSSRARAKLAPQALKAISCEVAEELEQAADPRWLWKGVHHAKLVDGFTFTMPDTAACQYILSAWMLLSASRIPAAALRELRLRLLAQIASCEVANRPGRFEPRVIKRRKHRCPFMNAPRAELRRRLATSTL